MTLWDAAQVASVVLASLGGAGVIIYGFSDFLGRVWANRLAESQRHESEASLAAQRGRIDEALARLDATLQHRNFLLQRFADIELQGVLACWKLARHSGVLVNDIRPVDSATDPDALNAKLVDLGEAHNKLLSTHGEYEPFLEESVRQILDDLLRLLRLELSQARRKPFTSGWWDQGETNRGQCEAYIEALRTAVRARVAALRRVADAG